MKDDVISKLEAIDTIREMSPKFLSADQHDAYIDKQEAMIRIGMMPSAQQWIPCSKLLPKEEIRDYWVCLEDGYQEQCRWMRYKKRDGYFYEWLSVMKVVAWMPLPESYKGR